MAIRERFNVDCVPLSTEKDTVFTEANARRDVKIPVQLQATVTDGLQPVVEQLKANTTANNRKPPYGLYVGRSPDGERVTIAREFVGEKVARTDETANAIGTTDLGKGVIASTTANENGAVQSGGDLHQRSTLERWEITGGNTVQGTTDAPAYFRVDSLGS